MSAIVEFIKTSNGLQYLNESDREDMKKIGKIGSVIRGKFSAPRSGKFHRKCRTLQDTIFDNQEKFEDKEAFREDLKLRTKCYVWMTDPNGKKYPKTKSTSYAKMNEVEHEKWYQELITFAINDGSVLEGKTAKEANAFVDSIIGGFA